MTDLQAADEGAPTIVLKFGSSVLRSEADLPVAVHEIYRWWRLGHRVIAVVSAFAGITDRLAAEARVESGTTAEASALALLLAVGERRTAGLLALHLDEAGVPARVLDPAGVGLTTTGPGLEADPAHVDCRRLEQALDACPVAVLPGFQAVDGRGVATLLGRGGSDMTAVFVAHRLGARCRLLKDVSGIFEDRPPDRTVAADGQRAVKPRGPSAAMRSAETSSAATSAAGVAGAAPRLFSSLTWEQAAAVGNGVVQHRALAFAEREGFALEVAAPAREFATRVGDRPATPVPHRDVAPLTVAILGLGHVGRAVFRRLAALPEHFQVVGVAVRDVARHRDDGVPAPLLCADPWALLERPADVVVEALPGADPARALLERALASGRDVVSANKAALAAAPWLLANRSTGGGSLRASAAVGGAVPVLETASRLAATGRLEAVHGVLNGTCGFVLERLEGGEALAAAVAEARRRGLAEADPAADLDGSDVARKLVLLAQAAFRATLPFEVVRRQGLDGLDEERVRAATAAGRRLCLVGSLTLRQGRVRAAVRPLVLPARHFLAGARGEENRVVFELAGARRVRLAGKGAGGRPTAEAVLGDLFDLWRLRRAATGGRDAVRLSRSRGNRHESEAADIRVDLKETSQLDGTDRGAGEVAR
ncbi:MAG: homoserine dehydrogenase [Thermoanaerobaculia bacterium]